jgi:hypothetical protein
MHVNPKMIPLKLIQELGEGRIKEHDGGGDIFDTL